MKKILLSITAGVTLLTACTSQDVIDESVQSNVIGFENVVNKQTRATELTADKFDNFYVFGYYTRGALDNDAVQIFNGEEVKRTLPDGNWTYTNTRYWSPGGIYYFYAYSCQDLKLSSAYGTFSMDMTESTKERRALNINNYRCDYQHQHDLIYAENEGMEGLPKSETTGQVANQTVKFKFKHLLSKVNATVTSDFPAGYTLEVSNIKMNNIINFASYNPKGISTKWHSHKMDRSDESVNPYINMPIFIGTMKNEHGNQVEYSNSTERSKAPVMTEPGFCIPFNYGNNNITATLTFDISVKREGNVVLQRNLKGDFNPNWEEGHAYTYNVTITGSDAKLEAIVFETDTEPITGWTSPTSTSITMETYTDDQGLKPN